MFTIFVILVTFFATNSMFSFFMVLLSLFVANATYNFVVIWREGAQAARDFEAMYPPRDTEAEQELMLLEDMLQQMQHSDEVGTARYSEAVRRYDILCEQLQIS